jgi:hypothetical protein
MATRAGLRRAVRPVSRKLEDVHEHLANESGAVREELTALRGQLQTIDLRDQLTHDHVAGLTARLLSLEARVRVDAEVLGEFARVSGRTVARLDERLDEITSVADGSLFDRLLELDPYFADRAVRTLVGTELAELGPGAAEYLNWATGPTGCAAQAGLAFTPAVTTRHAAGRFDTIWVNERIVEVPYVMGVLGELAVPSRVLDLGACYSTLALSAASLGHRVTALDLHPYPLEHPNLTSVACPVEDWAGPDEAYDVIVALSTVEHLGLGAYGEPAGEPSLDRIVLWRLRPWLAEGGRLVLTVPYGPWQVDGFQRVYDAEHLDVLLTGWKITDQRWYVQDGRMVWARHAGPPMLSSWSATKRAVALVTAFPTGEA